ncbi:MULTISPECIES: PIN domain-containing protein [unclassified Fibrobacter]|uniref:type II toxin-antitoxin system VapC family toxin n=1 Tax=unclassified Fibrobacter TaxID=2634177 RepID=UPI000D6A892D|nr:MULTISPECIES: PIN domain-containing protein [unclassified Fibrobacter]PWJ67092.1 PIN domain-containing protein [Fibrobacter sp. UWR4]PZW70659.1 PIN domain-containing protein [Fibrobacter sp. UWR1]
MNKAIEKSRILFLDTSAVVRLLQMHPDYYPVVSEVLDYAYEKNITLLASSVTLFELSQKACVAGEGVLARQYREFFEHSSNVKLCDVNGEIAVKAAELFAAANRTNHKLTEAESIRLATAFINGADCILTENENFANATDIPVVTLDEV